MLIIWNEDFIIKNFVFKIREYSKHILKRNKKLCPNSVQLHWLIEQITSIKPNDHLRIRTGYFDYPFTEPYKFIIIDDFKIRRLNDKTLVLENHGRSPYILYIILKCYKSLDENAFKKDILYLLRKPNIWIKLDNVYMIPQLNINNIDVTTIF